MQFLFFMAQFKVFSADVNLNIKQLMIINVPPRGLSIYVVLLPEYSTYKSVLLET